MAFDRFVKTGLICSSLITGISNQLRLYLFANDIAIAMQLRELVESIQNCLNNINDNPTDKDLILENVNSAKVFLSEIQRKVSSL